MAESVVVHEQKRFHKYLQGKGLADGYVSKIIAYGRAAIRFAWQNAEISSEP
ncbi:MAG: hypothetical protein AAGC95_15690 [Pseudomonadota bacterium]